MFPQRYEIFPFMHPFRNSLRSGSVPKLFPFIKQSREVAMPAKRRTDISALLLGNREDSFMHHSSSVDYMGNVSVP